VHGFQFILKLGEMHMNNYKKLLVLSSVVFLMSACGGSSDPAPTANESDEENNQIVSTVSDADGFPSELAVASPTDVSGDSFSSSVFRSISRAPNVAYSAAVDRIDDLLDGDLAIRDTFTPELFYANSVDANCYGPELQYENHPDSPGASADGTLPPGDLGIWVETEGANEACAAAQLNSRMESIKDQSYIALMSVASMIRVYIDDGNTWPDDISAGSSPTDVTALMNGLGITDTLFTAATIGLNTDGDQWTYSVDFTYTLDGEDLEISVDMIHQDGATDDEYEGLLTFMADSEFDPPGNCSSTDVTLNGSLHYIRNSETDIRLQSRAVQMCDHSESALAEAVVSDDIAGNVVDPDAAWGNNYHQFTAEFDPADLGGRYSYVWQAGKNDSHARILNICLSAATAGESYFGFGDQVQNSAADGSIDGFICNWAGPGNSHTLQDYAQRQHLTLNTTSGVFEPTNSAASDITYAPTNSCEYDGSGSFLYDRDLDESLADETSMTVNVGSGETLVFDLMSPSGTATNIWEHITDNRNYDLPAYPN